MALVRKTGAPPESVGDKRITKYFVIRSLNDRIGYGPTVSRLLAGSTLFAFTLAPGLATENHLARFVAEVVSELDLDAIYNEYGHRDNRPPN